MRIVYSPLDALKIARGHPAKEVVFSRWALRRRCQHGFYSAAGGARRRLEFFTAVQPHHDYRDDQGDPQLARADIGRLSRAGHVSMVIGTAPYGFIAENYKTDRRRRVRAARHSAVDRNGPASASRGTLHGRKPIPARRARVRQRPRASSDQPCLRTARVLRVARSRIDRSFRGSFPRGLCPLRR